jgi:Phosphotransferase enzyme family
MPALDPERVVALGRLSKATLRTVGRASQEVVVCERPGRRGTAGSGTHTMLVPPGAPLPLADESANVVVVTDRAWIRRLAREPDLAAEVARVLRPDAALYIEWNRFSAADARRALMRLEGEGLELWVAPGAGEVRAAVPTDEPAVIAWTSRRWLSRPLPLRRALRRPALAVARHPALKAIARRRAAVVRGDTSLDLPAYLAAAARDSGATIDGCRWSLVAPGDYNSQKVLVFLFDPEEHSPRAVVKMTRDPSFNDRLENEWRALTTLAPLPVASTLPRPLFRGTHAGLAIVGETAVEGLALRSVLRSEPSLAYAERGLDWLVELASSTASPGDSAGAAAALGALLERFLETYAVTSQERSFLLGQLASLERSVEPLPSVFQHGDPGAWNALVGPDGGLTFLDWEAAEHAGVPFWDLFYFARSMGVAVARTGTMRGASPGLGSVFLEPSELGRQLERAVCDLAERAGISLALVEPLFYLCWVHRALKEATRRRPDDLNRGVYIRLLRVCIERRDAPGLENLFTLGTSGSRSCGS